jgi:hypothetical protein
MANRPVIPLQSIEPDFSIARCLATAALHGPFALGLHMAGRP